MVAANPGSIIELVRFPASDAFRNELTASGFMKSFKDSVSLKDGVLSAAISGVQLGKPDTGLVLNVWNTIEASLASPELPQGVLAPTSNSPIERMHIGLSPSSVNPSLGPLAPLQAPMTEIAIVTPTVSEGKTRSDLRPGVEALVRALSEAQLKRGVDGKEGIGIVGGPVWGTLVENPEVCVVLVGWESAEAFQKMMESGRRGEGPIAEVAPKLRAVATVEFVLVKLA